MYHRKVFLKRFTKERMGVTFLPLVCHPDFMSNMNISELSTPEFRFVKYGPMIYFKGNFLWILER